MIRKTNKKTGSWPGVITRKDFDLMIKLCLCKEVEKRYAQEIQSLYKTPSFGLTMKNTLSTSTSSLGKVD